MEVVVTIALALDDFYQIEHLFSKDYVPLEHQEEYRVLVLKDIASLVQTGKH